MSVKQDIQKLVSAWNGLPDGDKVLVREVIDHLSKLTAIKMPQEVMEELKAVAMSLGMSMFMGGPAKMAEIVKAIEASIGNTQIRPPCEHGTIGLCGACTP